MKKLIFLLLLIPGFALAQVCPCTDLQLYEKINSVYRLSNPTPIKEAGFLDSLVKSKPSWGSVWKVSGTTNLTAPVVIQGANMIFDVDGTTGFDEPSVTISDAGFNYGGGVNARPFNVQDSPATFNTSLFDVQSGDTIRLAGPGIKIVDTSTGTNNIGDYLRAYTTTGLVRFEPGTSSVGSGGALQASNGSGGFSDSGITAVSGRLDVVSIGPDLNGPGHYTVSETATRFISSVQLGSMNYQTTGDGVADIAIFDFSTLPNNIIVSLDLVWVFIKSDGSDGGRIEISSVWTKDNSGTLTKYGDQAGLSLEVAAGTWALSTVNAGSFIQSRLTRSGSTSGTYRQAVYIKSKTVHSY